MVYLSTEPSVDTDLLQADSGRVFELCLDFLGLEMQPSVRHYQEWMCMRLVSRFPGLVAKLWPAFEKVSFLKLSVLRKWISFLAVRKCFIQFNSVYWYHHVDKQSIFIVNDYEDLHTMLWEHFSLFFILRGMKVVVTLITYCILPLRLVLVLSAYRNLTIMYILYVLNRKYKLLVTAPKNQYSRPLLTAPYCCSYRTTAAHEEPGKVYCLQINSCCEKRIKPSTQVHNVHVNSSYYCNK